jgi:hypothetical protein
MPICSSPFTNSIPAYSQTGCLQIAWPDLAYSLRSLLAMSAAASSSVLLGWYLGPAPSDMVSIHCNCGIVEGEGRVKALMWRGQER